MDLWSSYQFTCRTPRGFRS